MAQLSSYSKVWALSHMQAQGLFDFIQKRLMKEFYGDIERGVMRGFPEHYKRLLLERALEKSLEPKKDE